MKIGIDCRIFSSKFTGIGRYTHELVNELIKRTPHDLVLFFNQKEFNTYKPPNPRVKKVLVNAPHYSLAEQLKFPRIIRKEKIDHMHFPHFNVPILYRRPYSVTIHDITHSLFPGKKMTHFLHRLAYKFTIKNAVKTAKKVIAVSQNTKQDIMKFLNIASTKITVIHNGLSDDFTLIQDQTAIDKTLKKYDVQHPFLLYTGVWRYHKNLPRLIQALKMINVPDLSLVITGNEDPYYPEVKETVKDLHLEDRVKFVGLVEETELIHLYNAARIYVFPSLYEGFGFPPLEAMKCGTPVAASDRSSIPEVCGDAAEYFNPEDPEDIAKTVETIYRDADLQAELIEKGAEQSSKFSWEKMGEETYNVIESCLNLSKNS